jgi:hypothetical protein
LENVVNDAGERLEELGFGRVLDSLTVADERKRRGGKDDRLEPRGHIIAAI